MRLTRAFRFTAAGGRAITILVPAAVLGAIAMLMEFVSGVATVTGVTYLAFVRQKNFLTPALVDGRLDLLPHADQARHLFDGLVASTLVAAGRAGLSHGCSRTG